MECVAFDCGVGFNCWAVRRRRSLSTHVRICGHLTSSMGNLPRLVIRLCPLDSAAISMRTPRRWSLIWSRRLLIDVSLIEHIETTKKSNNQTNRAKPDKNKKQKKTMTDTDGFM